MPFYQIVLDRNRQWILLNEIMFGQWIQKSIELKIINQISCKQSSKAKTKQGKYHAQFLKWFPLDQNPWYEHPLTKSKLDLPLY